MLFCLASGKTSSREDVDSGLEVAQALCEFHFQKFFSVEQLKLYLLFLLLKLFYISFATL